MEYKRYMPNEDHIIVSYDSENSGTDPELGLPIPPRRLWHGYGNTGEAYLQRGKEDASRLISVIKDADASFEDFGRFLDFGCSAGRVLRWLSPFSEKVELWGCDIWSAALFWAQCNLADHARFFISSKDPHLPIGDGFFNGIYAGSVFSHIDEIAPTWLYELARVMASDGLAILTVNDEDSIRLIDTQFRDNPKVKQNFIGDERFQKFRNSNFRMFSLGRYIDETAKVFYANSFFEEIVSPFFEIVRHEPGYYGWQSGYVLRRRRR